MARPELVAAVGGALAIAMAALAGPRGLLPVAAAVALALRLERATRHWPRRPST